jgi:hypothetical protein
MGNSAQRSGLTLATFLAFRALPRFERQHHWQEQNPKRDEGPLARRSRHSTPVLGTSVASSAVAQGVIQRSVPLGCRPALLAASWPLKLGSIVALHLRWRWGTNQF